LRSIIDFVFLGTPEFPCIPLREVQLETMSARLMKKVLNEQHHLHEHVSEEEEEENDSEPITRSSINPFDLLNDQDSEPENQV